MKKLSAPAATLAALAVLLTGQAAFAEDSPKSDMKKPHRDRFKDADANTDGFLTKEEMQAQQQKRLDEMFGKTDADKDGKLSKDEMEKGREEMRKRWKDRKDARNDGQPPESR